MKKEVICVLVCMLMILVTVAPISATIDWKNRSQPLTIGNILYVGGIGPNNYTSIQDAINDALDGDTIFVFNDSSPYYENIIIEKSITLTGEEKETTVILGDESLDGIIVNVSADDVTIRGFTIQPSNGEPEGIVITRNFSSPDYWNIDIIQNIIISDTIIKNTYSGIFGIRLNHAELTRNIIDSCKGSGIMLYIPVNSNISNNCITNSSYRGIFIDGLFSTFRILNALHPIAANNIISQNTIKSNRWGIGLYSGPVNTIIDQNNIIDNLEIGIDIDQASKTRITQNNFINNSVDSIFVDSMVVRFPRFMSNSYDSNYWGEPKDIPVIINGTLVFSLFRYMEIGFSGKSFEFSTVYRLPWKVFDRHPVQEPFDIPGVN
jgi:nitrous oxidase accessory protein NosD